MFKYSPGLRYFVAHFFRSIFTFPEAWEFFILHRLWTGFRNYVILPIAALVAVLLISFKAWQGLSNWWQNSEGMEIYSIGSFFYVVWELLYEGYSFFAFGAFKYIILIVMEVFIFHSILKAHEILTGEKTILNFSRFVKAQVRMLKVSVMCFVVEIIFSIIFSIILSILFLDVLDPIFTFLTQALLVGFAIVDNYNEINGMSIRKSFKWSIRYFPGVTMGIGIILYVMLYIPLVGAVIGPILSAVAVSLLFHELLRLPEHAEAKAERLMVEGAINLDET